MKSEQRQTKNSNIHVVRTKQDATGHNLSEEDIAERAYLHHVRRGCIHGFDVEDWLNAENELIYESFNPAKKIEFDG